MKKFYICIVILFLILISGCTSNKKSSSSESNSSFEKLPINMDIIDTELDLLIKKYGNTFSEVDVANIRNIPIELSESQKLYCIFGEFNNEYLIVEENIVVGYITYNGSVQRDMSMKQYFPTDDCYNISPQIAWDDTYAYCCWETSNSYLVLGAVAPSSADENEYYNWPTTTYILIKDISQFTLYSEIK